MHIQDLDDVILDLKREFDSFLVSARNVEQIFEVTLKDTCLELLASEKKMAAKEGDQWSFSPLGSPMAM